MGITKMDHDFKCESFTCSQCGTFNGTTVHGAARDHCKDCGASTHVQFGDETHDPCGGVMLVKWTGERPFTSEVPEIEGGTFTLAQWRCECGYRMFSLLDEDMPNAPVLASMVLEALS